MPIWASQVVIVVKNSPANTGDIRDTGLIPGLEGGMATHSSTLAWRVPWTEEPATVHGVAKSQTCWATNISPAPWTVSGRLLKNKYTFVPFVFVLVNILLFIIENEEHFRENYITFWLRSIFPGGSVGKESVCNAGDQGSIPGWRRFPWSRK